MLEDSEPVLTPANENPWYLLATLYGEQSISHHSWDINDDLAARNRTAWNRWMISSIDGANRRRLTSKVAKATELENYSTAERMSVVQQFRVRAGNLDLGLPQADPFIEFENLVFTKAVDFRGFLFPNIVSFSSSQFASSARFDGAVFMHEADFQDATFCRPVSFYQAEFLGRGVLFQGVQFRSHTSFALAHFCEDVPDFRDAKLAEATEWHASKWPSAPKRKFSAQQQVYAYERLKAEMERLKKHEDEQFFFGKELRARRALLWFTAINKGGQRTEPEKSRTLSERVDAGFRWLLNWSYDFFSGYGLSIGRPLVALGALLCVGAVIFATTNSLDDGPLGPWEALELSATNLISFLPFKPDKWVTAHLSTNAKWLGNAQSFFGLVLLFLLGLALRNRFRMK